MDCPPWHLLRPPLNNIVSTWVWGFEAVLRLLLVRIWVQYMIEIILGGVALVALVCLIFASQAADFTIDTNLASRLRYISLVELVVESLLVFKFLIQNSLLAPDAVDKV